MIGKIPPKGVSFSDFICTFAMSFGDFAILVCSTKVGEKSDMASSRAPYSCSGTYKNNKLIVLRKLEYKKNHIEL